MKKVSAIATATLTVTTLDMSNASNIGADDGRKTEHGMVMGMREKLIELIGQAQDCGCDVTDVVEMNYVENDALADHLIANGVTIPVRCKECKYGILSEEDGLWQCVFSAEFNDDTGEWFGFINYNDANFYCRDGKRKGEGNG